LADQVDRAAVPGAAVVIVEDGRVVFARGYGRARDTVSMTPDTPVVVGSTSKSVTAVATLHLVEQGRLDLDAPLGEYLSWLAPMDRRVRDITIRQLLIDTSGIPTWAGWSALASDGEADATATRRLINNLRLSSTPGERFQYSNANYIVLGQVIEAVTGMPYGDVVETTVFAPLGMSHTHAAATDDSTPNRYWFGVPLRSRLPYLAVGIPAGAITSSASDLARYLQNQLHPAQPPTVLSPASVRLSHTPAVKAEGFGVAAGRHYAMGWYTGSVAGEAAVFHSGDVFDSSSSLIMLPGRDVGIAVVATTSSAITPVSKTLGEGVVATFVGRETPDLGRALAAGTMLAVALAGAALAFAVVRGRDLFALRPGTSPASLARVAIVDLAVRVAILLGLPALFSHYLDRAETMTAVEFWRLILRGVPDVGLLLILALVGRVAAACVTALRTTIHVVRGVEASRTGDAERRGLRFEPRH
jgi:CubicO group peptidase (beta-lactamase class C family)